MALAQFRRHSRQPAIRPVLRTRQACRSMRRLRVDRVKCARVLGMRARALIPQYNERALLCDLECTTRTIVSRNAMNSVGFQDLTAATVTWSPVAASAREAPIATAPFCQRLARILRSTSVLRRSRWIRSGQTCQTPVAGSSPQNQSRSVVTLLYQLRPCRRCGSVRQSQFRISRAIAPDHVRQ